MNLQNCKIYLVEVCCSSSAKVPRGGNICFLNNSFSNEDILFKKDGKNKKEDRKFKLFFD